MGVEVALIAATALAAGGAVYSGIQQQEAADTNAELARREAASAEATAATQAQRIRRAGRAQVGEATAALAASGVDLGSTTAIRIGEEITRNAESDAYATILSGKRQATTARDQAAVSEWQGSNAATAGVISGISTALGGYGRAKGGSNWIKAANTPIVERSSWGG
ncbi:hypothetical protein [Pigmentiphaga sp. CHJ604]|uniref:hypothetical protein n=1 Tax=Pigmentiphaga sp. CHJ604 TaxID=3081984 RepID=UPI0030D34590